MGMCSSLPPQKGFYPVKGKRTSLIKILNLLNSLNCRGCNTPPVSYLQKTKQNKNPFRLVQKASVLEKSPKFLKSN